MKRLVYVVLILIVAVSAITAFAASGMLDVPPRFPQVVLAQTADTPTPVPSQTNNDYIVEELESFEGKAAPPPFPGLDSTLNRLTEQVTGGHLSALAAVSELPVNQDEAVGVTVHIQEGYLEAISGFLTAGGASVRNTGTDFIEAYVPTSLLGSASGQEGVISIRTIVPPQPSQSRLSGAVTAHRAADWHSAGYRGQNVKIGIIDVGFESVRSLGSNELPAEIRTRCYTSLGVFTSNIASCESGGNHGTASMEAAFDIAPGATYFISNPLSSSDLQQTVRWMVSEGVDVINYSLSDLWEGPGDGTSPFSWSSLKSVDIAVGSGVIWTNAVGNGANETWLGQFVDVNGDGFHNFDGADQCNTFSESLSAGERLTAQLRWEGDWGGADTDLDLYLYRSPAVSGSQAVIVESSEADQNGSAGHYPREEILSFSIPTSGRYCLAVKLQSGTAPSWIQLQAFSGQEIEYRTSGSIRSPAESANSGMLAVGASAWNNNSVIEDFSGRGPTPDNRTKPDIVGADGAFSATYNGNWFGTSQASPHVAGLAALVRQRFPAYSPRQVASYLKTNASGRGAKPNNIWGYGFASLPSPGAVQPTPSPSPVPSPSPATLCFVAVSGSGTFNGTWDSDCVSVEPARTRSGDNYARFYTFTLADTSAVTITLTSDEDTYLNLRVGAERSGRIVYFNDDIAPGSNTNSRIEVGALPPASYTIEATTYYPETTGNFTLVVEIAGATVQPQPTPTARPGPLPTPTVPPTPQPTPSTPVSGFIDVSRGYDHACALHSNGSINCWGANDAGQSAPPASGRFIAISSHHKGSCAVRDDGAVLCWGSLVVNP